MYIEPVSPAPLLADVLAPGVVVPAVPAVPGVLEVPAVPAPLAVAPEAPAPLGVEPLVEPLVALVLPALPDAMPGCAFIRTNCPELELLPVVPVAVPVALVEPDVPTPPALPDDIEPPCCRQPVRVIAPWLLAPLCDDEVCVCAPTPAARPTVIATPPMVHIFFIDSS